jgi:hypothetical protein
MASADYKNEARYEVLAICRDRRWIAIGRVRGGDNGECRTISSATHGLLTNPEEWHRQLRRGGVVDEVRVAKDDEGNATVVTITADFGRGSPTTNVFFPSVGECELGKKLAELGASCRTSKA